MMKLRKLFSPILVFQILFQTQLGMTAPLSSEQKPVSTDTFMVQKEEATTKAGSVYVTPTKKNEVLFKASIWGAVQYPGVHYMPLGTRLLDALSLAGGPIEKADMDHLILSSHDLGNIKVHTISVTDALENIDHNPLLRPEDVLIVHEDRSIEKTSLYLHIGTFIISTIALGLLINQHH
jgi:hypothetical protein